MKKILIVSSSPFISGAEISLKQLLKNLDNEYDLRLITGNVTYFNDIKWSNQIFIKPIIDKCSLFHFIINSIRLNYMCVKRLKGFNPHVIYYNTTNSYLNLIWLSIFFYKSKKIWHVRDALKSKKKEYILGFLSDKIICISKFIDNNFTTNLKRNIVYGGIDVLSYKPIKVTQKNSNFKLVGCIAQLTPWKNQIDFIRAAKLIHDENPKTEFLIIGDILNPKDELYKKKLLDEIDSLGLNGIIKFTGFVVSIKKLILELDFIIHPSINEPFGRVLIEAMSMEKPVVSYKSGGPVEIIEHNRTGYLVEPYDYKNLAKHALILLNNTDLTSEFGRKGREKVKTQFGLEVHINKMKKLLI